MGSDFLERTKKTIKRSWDRQRVALATSDLLTRQPNCAGRSVAAEVVGNAKLSTGEKLTVESDAGGLVIRRGLDEVARTTDAPADVVQGIKDSCGIAVGTVDQVHERAHVVEITIC
ncbi:MAG: two-component system, response regulator / RNA-binding antiterminator [Acidobacteriaceae bacterium]